MNQTIAFIGGGNMASAIIHGLRAGAAPPPKLLVVEPHEPARRKLQADFGVDAMEHAGPQLQAADLVVWAVKPQLFQQAAQQGAEFTRNALHLSVAAGIPSDSIARWLGTQSVVRAMPNTPALIGKGITALFARAGVTPAQCAQIEHVARSTGEFLWLDAEEKLDAVTALSGSGPAYVFYFLEAMAACGTSMGLTAQQAHQLAVATFVGASELARSSDDSPQVLRQRVTSKGGTTHAAISSMENAGLRQLFENAIFAAQRRAQEMGQEFGAS
ncbi:MAG: pyrroline-5-carboxylate reductase [Rhodoferax sp.]|nr:pyrroline-5-carboxylate reductase [Rhodoferax sp.]